SLVFARTGGDGPRGVTAFLVPTGAAGFETREIKGKLGLRGQATASLHLDEVRVPDANRLGEQGKGFRVAMSALDKGRMSIAAGCVGIARGCLEAATGDAAEGVQCGKPIAGHQLVQELLADTAVDVDAGRMLTWLVADLLDRGDRISPSEFSIAASKAKLFASEAAVR